ncbi:hypothetical protein NG798_24230 [Ancylothrix sp. C2]|uniref:hypothetical protein n=1 Tax=Ancylothrix sp. D3o TaxID=2953691 RepID=UPI0021BBA71F|nr:hypothetical protein [Ancylothrix sp. D3o]MCT7952912.1 hypothetical protein [Ancylothrix sp. D3o]
MTDNVNYQYMQCLAQEGGAPTDNIPQGIEIRWTTKELYGRVIGRKTIAGRNSIIYVDDNQLHQQVYVAIPSQGGHVIVSAYLCAKEICLEEGFRRIINSLVVP